MTTEQEVSTAPEDKQKKVSNLWPTGWFADHLNWTVVLFPAVFLSVCFVSGFIIGLIAPDTTDSVLEPWINVLTVLYFIGFIYLLVWNIIHKGRSLWHLLWLLTGWGTIVILCLANKTLSTSNTIERPYKHSTGKLLAIFGSLFAIVIIIALVYQALAG
jgi:hypothetical protein